MSDEQSAQKLTATLLADPPSIHEMGAGGRTLGVWATDRSCYEFIATHCSPGARTLETGLGISTILFAASGAHHVCVAPADYEIAHLRTYCEDRNISLDRVTFKVGFSQDVLPGLVTEPLDLVLIDGCHGFPAPILDWYYSCRLLGRHGIVVLDDVPLPAVQLVDEILQLDPRWTALERGANWASYRRTGEVRSSEDWHEQPWLSAGLGLRRDWRQAFAAEHQRPAKILRPLYRATRQAARRFTR
jgi:hypothetical protein